MAIQVKGFIEIFLMYDRYLVLKNVKNWFNKKRNFKYIVSMCLVTSLVIYCPDNFSSILVPVANSTVLIRFQTTDFGKSKFYYYYGLLINLLANFATIVALITFSFLVVIQYKKFIDNKRRFVSTLQSKPNLNTAAPVNVKSSNVKLKKKDLKFVQMTIILNFLYTVMRIFDLAFNMDYFLNKINGVLYRAESMYLKNLNFILIYFIESINFFMLFIWNETFRRSIHSIVEFRSRAETSHTHN